jgi:hypothetical protein
MPPPRVELGDLDRERWKIYSKGRDPWQFGWQLPLTDSLGEVFIYSTGTQGGKAALAELQDAYADHLEAHPDEAAPRLPMVVLESDGYQHEEFGRVATPKFGVAEWVTPPATLKLPKPPTPANKELLAIESSASALPFDDRDTAAVDDLGGDSIPF